MFHDSSEWRLASIFGSDRFCYDSGKNPLTYPLTCVCPGVLGKLYVAAVLFFNVPTGMILAVYANGHLPTKTAFIILDCLWEAALKHLQSIRKLMAWTDPT